MKIEVNGPCPCGSGKKYKFCCMRKEKKTEYDRINDIILTSGYDDKVSKLICGLYRYMREKIWTGACHATCSILYVGLSELGYSPTICIGEAADVHRPRFDHSWIKLDGKILDLAIAIPLWGHEQFAGPVVFDVDLYKGTKHELIYGVPGGSLDAAARVAIDTPFSEYMSSYPDGQNGLWGILEYVYPGKIEIEKLKIKYADTKREFVK